MQRRIVLVVYDGVLADECDAFRAVLGLLPHSELLTAGARVGACAGPGGVQRIDVTFDAIERADVVVVPGGLGCERACDDPELRAFLQRMETGAQYLAASSTGTVVLAAAGLLRGASAATHWLASDLLRRHGSETADRRLVVTGNVITCEGRVSAVDAAFALVERIEGAARAASIRETLLERGRPLLSRRSWWEQTVERVAGRPAARRAREGGVGGMTPVTPRSVMIELVDNDELARRLRRSTRARRHPD